MGNKNHLINLRLSDGQIKFIRELTGESFNGNISDAVRFCIDFLNVMLSMGIIVDLSEHPEIAEKLNPSNITTDWDETAEEPT